MNWQLLFARDGAVWRVLFYGGLIFLSAVTIIDGSFADYGFSPMAWRWVTLAAAIITAVGGKFGLSPLNKKADL